MKRVFLSMSLLSAFAAFALGPTISGVTYSQPSGAGAVTIEYTVSESAIVTIDVLTNGVSLGAANLQDFSEAGVPAETGSAFNRVVAAGAHTVKWKPYKSLPPMSFKNGEVDVKLTAYSLKAPPLYLLADLTSKSNVHYYASVDDLPFGPRVTNAPYRTTHLLMRRIDAAGIRWRMGAASLDMSKDVQSKDSSTLTHETPHFVTLTNDYYIGVFEVTQGQHARVTGARPSGYGDEVRYPERDVMPVERVSVSSLTGSTKWRLSGSSVKDGSGLDKWRQLTSLTLDIPTEAQWEFACRAGSTNSFHNGTDDITNASGLGKLGWYNGTNNVGGRTHPVGEKEPNDWGLYDTHGNVFESTMSEWTKDVSSDPLVEPTGYVNGTSGSAVRKGGSYDYSATAASAATGRSISFSDSVSSNTGYRVWAPLPTAIP